MDGVAILAKSSELIVTRVELPGDPDDAAGANDAGKLIRVNLLAQAGFGDAVELAVQQRETRRARVHVLADKALLNPSSLSLKDLDDICTLAEKLGPTSYVPPDPIVAGCS